MSAFGVNFSLIKIENTCGVVNGVHSAKYPLSSDFEDVNKVLG